MILRKILTTFILIIAIGFFFAESVFAIPSLYQRCEPGSTCIIGEYVFDDDGKTAITTDNYCKITITNPSDSVIASSVNMTDKNDGWYYYSTTTPSMEGLYRTLVCCDVGGTDERCIDKTFVAGTSFDTISDIDTEVNLIRGATFDFSGFADSGTTLTLVDSELSQTDDYWNDYKLRMLTGSNTGEEQTVSDFVASNDTITLSSSFSNAVASGDKYVLLHEDRLVFKIWNYSARTLTSFGTLVSDVWSYSGGRTLTSATNIAADIWNATTRRLTDKILTDGGNLATESYIDTATSTIIAEIDANETLINTLSSDISSLSATTTLIYNKWSTYSAADIIGYIDDVESRLGTSADATTTATIFGRVNLLQEKWGTQTSQSIYDTASSTLAAVQTVRSELGYSGTSTTAFANLEVVKGYVDELESYVGDPTDTATSTLFGAIKDNRSKLDQLDTLEAKIDTIDAVVDSNAVLIANLDSDVAALSATTTLILNKWSTYSAADIIGYIDDVESILGTSTDATTTTTVLGQINLLKENWGTQTAQSIFDKASSTLAAVQSVQTELGYNGTSTTAYAEMQLIKGYVDELEGYVGDPTDTSTSTLFGAIKDVRTKVDQLDTLETKLDAVDAVVDLIRASQQLDYTVELSDVGEVLQGNTYRAKLSIWDYENNPANASTTPTIVIYDTTRATATSTSMSLLSTGVYEVTYSVPASSTSGLWETTVSVDLGGASTITLNDYWEVEGSPAQVIINSMSDVTVPSISANVTITNEGNAGYEYQYEWCVVDSESNACGGEDDIDYASAAKYINVAEDWITQLDLTVPDVGDYWFKVVVYYGTEASGASRTFTAIEEVVEEEVTPSGGGSITTGSLTNIYNLLQDLHDEVGYHGKGRTVYQDISNTRYSLGALPNQLSEPMYEVLTGISTNIQDIGGDEAYSLNDIYAVIEANAGDLSYVINKTSELQAMLEVNKKLVIQVANKPIIQTWFTEGSIILNIMVINPPDMDRVVAVKEYLPKEIREEHIIEIEEGLQLKYDSNLDSYFVEGEVKLKAGERKIFKVRAEDVFVISEEELLSLKEQAETLMEPLKGTGYFAQASILKSEIDANLQSISRTQIEGPSNIERRISVYRRNWKDLEKVYENMNALKIIVSEASGKGGVLGSLFGVSATMTWAIIIIMVVGVAVLMILLYSFLMRQRAMEYHLSGGTKLQAPPLVDVKKYTTKVKGGLITYFLPPFGKQEADLQQMLKMIKILIGVIVLIILVLLGMRFYGLNNNVVISDIESSSENKILIPDYVADYTSESIDESDMKIE